MPVLSYPGGAGTYFAISVDSDAPFASAPFLAPILHWVQPSLKAGANDILKSSEPNTTDWVKPNPPPFSGPHRYLFLLFKQPDHLDLKALSAKFPAPMRLMSRVRWDLDAFISEFSLGEPVAVNWFTSV